jgi:hypothetical protein
VRGLAGERADDGPVLLEFVGADPLPNEPFVRLDEESFGAYLRAHGGSRRASGASMMGGTGTPLDYCLIPWSDR